MTKHRGKTKSFFGFKEMLMKVRRPAGGGKNPFQKIASTLELAKLTTGLLETADVDSDLIMMMMCDITDFLSNQIPIKSKVLLLIS